MQVQHFQSGNSSRMVNLRRLKRFADEKLGRSSILRYVLLEESDEIPAIEFVSKLQIWLALLRHRDAGNVDWNSSVGIANE
jgi:hypothetical protein